MSTNMNTNTSFTKVFEYEYFWKVFEYIYEYFWNLFEYIYEYFWKVFKYIDKCYLPLLFSLQWLVIHAF